MLVASLLLPIQWSRVAVGQGEHFLNDKTCRVFVRGISHQGKPILQAQSCRPDYYPVFFQDKKAVPQFNTQEVVPVGLESYSLYYQLL